MRLILFTFTLLAVTVVLAAPAAARVVIEEDFEDDVFVEDNFIVEDGVQVLLRHFTNGPPTNDGRPGEWIPNQYDVSRMGFKVDLNGNGLLDEGDEWFDPLDLNPDTGWQFSLVKDFVNPYDDPLASSQIRNPPERSGNEGFIMSHHGDGEKQDCRPENPCNVLNRVGDPSLRQHRGGFIRFTDANGDPVIAEPGDTVRGKFDFVAAGGNTAMALTNDIDAMVARTADESLNLPYTKWNVGFGQPFRARPQPDLGGWQGHVMDPYVIAQLEFNSGFNQEYFGSRVTTLEKEKCIATGTTNCSAAIELVPDQDFCSVDLMNMADQCGPGTVPPDQMRQTMDDEFTRYQTMELEYTVGEDTWKLWMDGVEVSTQHTTETDTGGRDINQEWGLPVPVGQPVPPMGQQQINGVIFGTTGDRTANGANRNRYALFVDDICFTVNESLDGCFASGPTPLLGDANNDSQVTGGDLIAVQQNFGSVDPNSPSDGLFRGDANDDGQVTGADLIAVQQNFGNVATAAVPEPASVCLMTLAGLGVWARRRGS